jgi:hypothetical protein
MISKMWVRCQIQIEVKHNGQKFYTLEECPMGYPAGLEPGDLMDLCVACPKSEPQVLANIHLPKLTPVPKKKHPTPKK